MPNIKNKIFSLTNKFSEKVSNFFPRLPEESLIQYMKLSTAQFWVQIQIRNSKSWRD